MSDSKHSDLAEVIHRAQKGDSEAFTYLYESFYTPLYRYVFYRLRGSKADAEDVTQEVFVKIYTSLGSYKASPDANPLPYFYTIAKNTLIDRSRKKKLSMVSLAEDDTMLVDAPDKEDTAEIAFGKREDAKELHDKIALLPHEQQDVIILRFIDELSTKETADALGKTEEAVRQLQSRGLKSLRNIFNSND